MLLVARGWLLVAGGWWLVANAATVRIEDTLRTADGKAATGTLTIVPTAALPGAVKDYMTVALRAGKVAVSLEASDTIPYLVTYRLKGETYSRYWLVSTTAVGTQTVADVELAESVARLELAAGQCVRIGGTLVCAPAAGGEPAVDPRGKTWSQLTSWTWSQLNTYVWSEMQ